MMVIYDADAEIFEGLGSHFFAYKLHYLQVNIGLASEKAAIAAFFISTFTFCFTFSFVCHN